jgi:Zinc-finger double-stranded RNA-binding
MPSDFSQSQQRKFLKKSAVPSVIRASKLLNNRKDSEVANDEDDEPVEVQVEAEDPLDCNVATSCGLCKSFSSLTAVEDYHKGIIRKCLPLVMINESFLQKLCKNCLSILDTFSLFIDKVLTVQNSYIPTLYENYSAHDSNIIQTQRIKVEPMANIEEEVKFPSIQVINFTQEPPSFNPFAQQKKCEILEIVDIKPFNFDGTLQQENYDDEDEIQILSPTELKVELTDPDEDGSNELEQIRNYVFISTVFLQDHNYYKTPALKIAEENVKMEYDDEIIDSIAQPLEVHRICTLCNNKSFKSFKKFLIHKMIVHQPNKSKLKHHRKVLVANNQQKIRKICSKIIKQKKEKMMKENEKPLPSKKNQKRVTGKSYTCPICFKNFRGPKNLYQHKISHQISSYYCTLCDKRFKRAHGLKQHVKSIHEKVKNFQCPICNHRYLLKADMQKCRHRALKKVS